MGSHKFESKDLNKLNNPNRLKILDISRVCSHFKLQGQMVLAEIGTGTAAFAEALLNLLPEAQCHALDILPEMVEWIQKNRETYKSGRLIPQLMQEAKIPLQDNLVDFLFMITLHHEMDQPVRLLKECRRILKPGCRILVADWDKKAMNRRRHKDHFIDASVAISHLEIAGFKNIATFDGSKRLFCVGAMKP